MSDIYYFVNIDDQLHAVLNYEQLHAGSDAFVLYPIEGGRAVIYHKLKAKAWTDAAIHERLFPRSHLQGKWTPFCAHGYEPGLISLHALMAWSKRELTDAIRSHAGAYLPSLANMNKRDLGVLYRHLLRLAGQAAQRKLA